VSESTPVASQLDVNIYLPTMPDAIITDPLPDPMHLAESQECLCRNKEIALCVWVGVNVHEKTTA
jgi:hypothetical protein